MRPVETTCVCRKQTLPFGAFHCGVAVSPLPHRIGLVSHSAARSIESVRAFMCLFFEISLDSSLIDVQWCILTLPSQDSHRFVATIFPDREPHFKQRYRPNFTNLLSLCLFVWTAWFGVWYNTPCL